MRLHLNIIVGIKIIRVALRTVSVTLIASSTGPKEVNQPVDPHWACPTETSYCCGCHPPNCPSLLRRRTEADLRGKPRFRKCRGNIPMVNLPLMGDSTVYELVNFVSPSFSHLSVGDTNADLPSSNDNANMEMCFKSSA
jgi:hypothetical protein